MARLFVAVYPPAPVVESLAALPRPDAPGVRWVPPEQYHVTLRFLPDADPDAVTAALDAGAPARRQTEVVLGPRVSRLGRTVLCVPATGLEELASAVGQATAECAPPPDPRPFRGHVTLARLKHRAACGLAGAPFEARFEATEVHLVRSVTRAEGAQHERLTSWRLPA